ncbi:hypothetical protein N7456_001407 [Penicillium angulare]|uniref:EKC/KEOPS complex subunit BUD32 n=1 Tax=Penicillium angulare TaxID=116970 RepID=A0A9W9KPB6_9EURO|nr:hypothetical protein N7456_001407 [Penicillium angulare]
MVALGGAAVIKAPIKHNTTGCSQKVIESAKNREEYSETCIDREKLIYRILPKDPNILNCLAITSKGIYFPYLRHGNVRDYLQMHNHRLDKNTRDQWIENAVCAIATIHAHGVVHSDISARNFLVADDFSIKLCDFAGSGTDSLESLAQEESPEEESPYQIFPWSPRTNKTDLFALGSFIYEVSTGLRPFVDIDDEEIERRYAAQIFPCLDGLKYCEIISKCWRLQYSSARILESDVLRCAQSSS